MIKFKLFKDNIENKYLKYDYYLPNIKILIEINEPCHYDFNSFKRVSHNHGTMTDFIKYQKDFETKIKLAKENDIKLIIIDVEKNKSKNYYYALYTEKMREYL